MIVAYHTIFTCRGFWLPNDGRGSWSTEVWADHLRPFGRATKTNVRRSLANSPHDRETRRAAKDALIYPAVRFSGQQARAVAYGFRNISQLLDLRLFACSILPDHTHLVIGVHKKSIEQIVGFLKRAASRELTRQSLHPFEGYRDGSGWVPSPWVEGGWNRFLNSDADVVGAIDYTEQNPLKMGLRRQTWSFVIPYPL
jgi:REP element-mobilizing transposase RayT